MKNKNFISRLNNRVPSRRLIPNFYPQSIIGRPEWNFIKLKTKKFTHHFQ